MAFHSILVPYHIQNIHFLRRRFLAVSVLDWFSETLNFLSIGFRV